MNRKRGFEQRQAKMFHLVSDNYLISPVFLSELAFDLMHVSLQDENNACDCAMIGKSHMLKLHVELGNLLPPFLPG